MSEALEENAAELHFGANFRVDWHLDGTNIEPNVQVLSNDEVYFLLEIQRQKMLEPPHSVDELNDTFKSLHSHLEKMVTTKHFQDLQNVASDLGPALAAMEFERNLDKVLEPMHPYERSSLINLLKASDTTPEECKHWIPSLDRYDNDQIQRAIDLIIHHKEKVTQGI